MTIRVRGIVASILLVAFMFMSIGVFLPRKAMGHQNRGRFTTTKDEDVDFRLLIGVMSRSWSLARRQIIRNAYRQFPSNLPVDVVFIQANTASFNENNNDRVMAMHQIAMTWENDTFHDILHLNCTENLVEGKTYEYLRKVGSERSTKYTHVMKTDDDSFVNIPGIPILYNSNVALLQVVYEHRKQKGFYWGTTWQDGRWPAEMWGSGYILSMDLVKWISVSDIPARDQVGYEDLKVIEWMIEGEIEYHRFVNITAFGGYPWPELGDYEYKQENEVRPFDRWTLVTHPLKEDFMWIETANWYLDLKW